MRLARRARIILMAADGAESQTIAQRLHISRPTVQLWRERFLALRVAGLEEDAPRPGRRASISGEKIRAVVTATVGTRRPYATPWSTRSMARAHGLSGATVRRIWKQHNLTPHLGKTGRRSRDKHVVENRTGVVALYMNPPDTSLVLCVDRRSHRRARDRTRSDLPMEQDRSRIRLCAALGKLEGSVVGDSMPRYRHQECIRFLKKVDTATPAGLHLIAINSGTHTHPRVTSWLERHTRFHLHWRRTSRSWLNLVERWLRRIASRCIRGTLQSMAALSTAIRDYLNNQKQKPRVFVWIASAEDILVQPPTVKKQ